MKLNKPPSIHSYKRSRLLIALVAVLVLIGVFLYLDIPARQRFSAVNNEVQKIVTSALKPAGAVERNSGGYTPHSQGNGFLDSLGCFPDVHCPTISKDWFVPIEPGKERQFALAALEDHGYNAEIRDESACNTITTGSTCRVWGTKDKFSLRVEIKPSGSIQPPTNDMAPKQWWLVTVAADYYWDR